LKAKNLDKSGTIEFRKKGFKGKEERNGFNASGQTLGEEATRGRFFFLFLLDFSYIWIN